MGRGKVIGAGVYFQGPGFRGKSVLPNKLKWWLQNFFHRIVHEEGIMLIFHVHTLIR